ncbi:hypothetical protein CEV32_4793 [Brucella rhizosphaerae]|uniref:Uncharacterized protein n=1 Tax=Brucella rhizosphaerae TaxID=571254 RepID=A0A256FL66_9HYPH|nr:hypothetical protein CEV32_4793 [Brucella rhizosphaerae]
MFPVERLALCGRTLAICAGCELVQLAVPILKAGLLLL